MRLAAMLLAASRKTLLLHRGIALQPCQLCIVLLYLPLIVDVANLRRRDPHKNTLANSCSQLALLE